MSSALIVSCSKSGNSSNPDGGGGNTPQNSNGKIPGTSPNGEKPVALNEQDKSRFIAEFKKLDSFQKAIGYAFDPDQSPNLNESFTKEIYDLFKQGACIVDKKKLMLTFEEGEHLIDENGHLRLSGPKCPVVVNDSMILKGKSIINSSNPENLQISMNTNFQSKNYRKNLDSDVIAKTGVLEILTDLTGTTKTSTVANGMSVSSDTDGNQKIIYVGGRIYNVLVKVVQVESSTRTEQTSTRTKELYVNYHVKGSDIDALLQVFSKMTSDSAEVTKVYLNGQDVTAQAGDVGLSILAVNSSAN